MSAAMETVEYLAGLERAIDALRNPTPENLLDPDVWYWYLLQRKLEKLVRG